MGDCCASCAKQLVYSLLLTARDS